MQLKQRNISSTVRRAILLLFLGKHLEFCFHYFRLLQDPNVLMFIRYLQPSTEQIKYHAHVARQKICRFMWYAKEYVCSDVARRKSCLRPCGSQPEQTFETLTGGKELLLFTPGVTTKITLRKSSLGDIKEKSPPQQRKTSMILQNTGHILTE